MTERYDFADESWDVGDKLALLDHFLHQLNAFGTEDEIAEGINRGKLLDPFGNDCSYVLEGNDESLICHRVEDTKRRLKTILSRLTGEYSG